MWCIYIGRPIAADLTQEYQDIPTLAQHCFSTKDLVEKMKLTELEIGSLERDTVGQSSNELWKRMRLGRITASNFYRVFTKVETLKKEPSTDCSKLIRSLISPTPLGHLPQIAEGIKNELLLCKKLQKFYVAHTRMLAFRNVDFMFTKPSHTWELVPMAYLPALVVMLLH